MPTSVPLLLTSYGYATLTVLAAAGIRFLLQPVLVRETPFMVFLLAVFVSAIRGGLPVGLYATVLSVTIGLPLFMAPGPGAGRLTAPDTVNLLLFVCESSLISWVVGLMRASERRAMESERAIQAANDQRADFVALVSHEVRNPLTAIQSALGVMRHRIDQAAGQRARQVIERQAAHIGRLVDDLLDSIRIERGKLSVNRDEVALSPILEAAVEVTRPWIELRGQRLTLDIPADAITVDADAGRLQQVIANLLVNASKYTPVGGWISLSLSCTDGMAIITVKDSGLGLAPEHLRAVFDPYVRVSRDVQGLGLGLHIARYLTERHGGTIDAESAGPGHGSTFTVRLPATMRLSPGCEPSMRAVAITG